MLCRRRIRSSDSTNSTNAISGTTAAKAPTAGGNGFFAGDVGIGTEAPASRLDVRGNLTLDPGASPILFTSTANTEQNRYLQLLNSPTLLSASGLKAGGILVADQFDYANPTKNDLIVKGKVGIGALTSPSATLHVIGHPGDIVITADADGSSAAVVGTSGSGVALQGNTLDGTAIYGTATSGFAGYFVGKVDVTNALGIATESPQRPLHVNGRARIGLIPLEASAAAVCFNPQGDLLQCGASSLRWKENVHAFSGGLDIIRRLRPISFNWKEGGQADIGLGAEDVAKVAPSLTFVDGNGEAEGVKYERLNLLLINAVKEQQEEIQQQQEENSMLKARIDRLERSIEMLRRSVRTRDTQQR